MREFVSLLCALSNSDRDSIKRLTLMADANKENAATIVDYIQIHMIQSSPKSKLAALYLIDSIVKNIRGEFVEKFGYKMATIFSQVFTEANLDMRRKLFALRQTWKRTFSEITLLALDNKVKEIDPAWPITASVKFGTLDHLKSEKEVLQLKLRATVLQITELDQQLQDEPTNTEKETAFFTSAGEYGLQAPASKKIKLDWMDAKAETKEIDHRDAIDLQGNEDAVLLTTNGVDDGDDDDVIEVITEPTIIEVIDDNDDEISSSNVSSTDAVASASDNTSSTVVTSSTNHPDSDTHWIDNSTIDVKRLFENSIKIKVEPKDDENADDDDCFEDIGEIFDSEVSETADNRHQPTTSSHQMEKPISVLPTMDGNVPFASSVNVKINNNIKINIKNPTVRIITAAERAAKNENNSLKRKIAVPVVRPKADETSALCTIM